MRITPPLPTARRRPPVPEALRGKLQAAGASVLPVAPAEPVAPPRIGALLVRSDDDQCVGAQWRAAGSGVPLRFLRDQHTHRASSASRSLLPAPLLPWLRRVPLRTGPGVLRVLLKELAESRTLVQAQHAARVVKDRFLSTGVYNDVSVSAQEAVASNGAVRPDVADVVVGVRPRRTMALSVGGMQSLSGKLEGVSSPRVAQRGRRQERVCREPHTRRPTHARVLPPLPLSPGGCRVRS